MEIKFQRVREREKERESFKALFSSYQLYVVYFRGQQELCKSVLNVCLCPLFRTTQDKVPVHSTFYAFLAK